MTTFWSLWIIVITIGTLVGCAILLTWCAKDKMGVEEGADMGHEYDGIRELNNPLPKWWTYLFVSTFVFSAVYLALFPGLGSFKGFLNWESSAQEVRSLEESKQAIAAAQENKQLNQYAKELDDADAYFGEAFRKLAHNENGLRPIPEIANDPEALKVGQRLFLQNCSQCHGSDARGQQGFPNLTDNAWLYGGEPQAIVTTIMHGRVGQMPAWKDALGEEGVQEVVSYALSLSGRKVNAREAAAGKARFVVCAACHGTDGKGNPAVGAPDLTDQDWLFGDSRAAVTETVMNGRSGVMPAWKDILGEDKIQLVASYVWSLSNSESK
ncbi:cytochrome-c oxidase, cbb3-type subunit III [Vibrio natriegens]|jgi:cytochrome c oxidase cbb3-type subunit 3|uniref:Cbb3-type cytochrome c oxidase subunit n=1 Tax=Vibrio natriegens NBRC 15636 = ATCC 14048 = DSM 759 TaxID=1219067 RepID=A0AAN1CVL2_VIBNA|nr:cytochrome-c oxidase, cbb3-type subunit III [Vibrio natriegens]WMN88603.1 cytochrome-c oxidase, cbb3-type subunit III [Vibrio parahaemolyticus]ALR15506.1 cytochrome Cbb3 [Vibrio natriegens NBRC 15636 = ATCC 14048 = DSM 759]ANQ12634.1 cytochrome c oxidase, cbb3-type subunit III [Vibrio natriegens NBRC 15636 = ATCC 14048 = DSM 759]ANQ21635.1 cytochrome c oxidase, cbb3-type subunit III [Vibrio natriegens]EPM42223.1 cytochrome CBB3 [Vibrio natriegens NBRC 15636 = ATCC 14048 = DSM 759]